MARLRRKKGLDRLKAHARRLRKAWKLPERPDYTGPRMVSLCAWLSRFLGTPDDGLMLFASVDAFGPVPTWAKTHAAAKGVHPREILAEKALPWLKRRWRSIQYTRRYGHPPVGAIVHQYVKTAQGQELRQHRVVRKKARFALVPAPDVKA